MPLLAPMPPRDTHEEHRTATPLELFFDLTFVVAIAQAGSSLHHGLVDGDAGDALLSFPLVFFAIWWAWMNFTWFASAYDNDDVAYRLTVFVLMTGVLILAAGVPRAFDDQDFGVITLGYVVMRLAMVGLWLRAAAQHPEGRSVRAALRPRHRGAPGRLGAAPRPARGRRPRRVLRAGRARALGAGVGRGDRADDLAPAAHRRAVRVVHDHRARRVGARSDGRRADRARPRRPLRGRRDGRRRRPAHAVRDVVDLLRHADGASHRAGARVVRRRAQRRVRVGLRALLRVRRGGGDGRRSRRRRRPSHRPLRAHRRAGGVRVHGARSSCSWSWCGCCTCRSKCRLRCAISASRLRRA